MDCYFGRGQLSWNPDVQTLKIYWGIIMVKHQFTQSKQLIHLQSFHQHRQIDKFLQEANRLLNIPTTFNYQSKIIISRYQHIYSLINTYLATDQGYPKDWYVHTSNQSASIGVHLNNDLIKTKFQGIIQIKLTQAWQLLMDCNGYKQWMPFCTSSNLKQSINEFEKLVYLKFKVPLLNERFLYLSIMGIDRLQYNGTLLIYCQGISQQLVHLEKCSPINLKHLMIEIKHEGKKLRIRTYGEVKSRIGMLPMWISNTIIKRLNTYGNRKPINHQKSSPIVYKAIMKYLNKL